MLTTRLVEVVRRRWLIVIGGIVITAGLVLLTTRLVAPDQSVTATVLVLPPATPVTDGGGKTNPYLQLGGLTSPTEILARALNDPKIRDTIVPQGSTGDYVAERDLSTSAPVMLVTAEAPNLSRARDIVQRVLAVTPQVIGELQSSIGVPTASQLTSEVLSPEGQPTAKSKAMIRAVLVVAAGGIGATLALAAGLDTLIARRREPAGAHARRDPSLEHL